MCHPGRSRPCRVERRIPFRWPGVSGAVRAAPLLRQPFGSRATTSALSQTACRWPACSPLRGDGRARTVGLRSATPTLFLLSYVPRRAGPPTWWRRIRREGVLPAGPGACRSVPGAPLGDSRAIHCGVLKLRCRRRTRRGQHGQQESNPHPPVLETGALTELSYARRGRGRWWCRATKTPPGPGSGWAARGFASGEASCATGPGCAGFRPGSRVARSRTWRPRRAACAAALRSRYATTSRTPVGLVGVAWC